MPPRRSLPERRGLLNRAAARTSAAQRYLSLRWFNLRAQALGRPRPWEPRRLLAASATLRLRYDHFRMQAREAGEPHPELFAVLKRFGSHGVDRANAYREVITERHIALVSQLNRGTADAIAGYLAQEFLVSLAADVQITHDDRRRTAGAWAAILAPSVALREKAGRRLTIDSMTTLVSEWLETGTTADAMDAALHRNRVVRAFANHPARCYDLLCDRGDCHQVSSADVMLGLVLGVGLPLAAFARTVELLAEQRETEAAAS